MKQFKGVWADKPNQMKIYYLAIMVVAGLSIFSMIGSFLALSIFDVDFFSNKDLFKQTDNPSVIAALQLMHVFSVLGTFLIPAWAYHYTVGKGPFKQLFECKPSAFLLLGLAAIFACLPFVSWLQEWNASWQLPESMETVNNWLQKLEQNSLQIQQAFLQMDGLADLFTNLFLMAVLPAVAEELLFRGILQPFFTDWFKNAHNAIWLTAFLFAAFHQQFHGIVPLLLMGALLGYIRYWSNNLWPAILAHFANNTLMLLGVYFSWETNTHWLTYLALGLALITSLYLMQRKAQVSS